MVIRSIPFLNQAAIELGQRNHARCLGWARLHPFGTQQECAADLGLSPMAVNRHVKAIRAEWRAAMGETAS